MKQPSLVVLTAQALWELLRYDIDIKLRGFGRIHRSLAGTRTRQPAGGPDVEERIGEAMKWALSLYCKPALCLQRSVAMTRLLKKHGIDAQVVIGYRPEPLAGHAWVEFQGRVLNDSQSYRRRMLVLERI